MNQEADFYAAMKTRYAALSGNTPDEATDLALRFHTLAACLAELSTRFDTAKRQLFAATADGEMLEAHALACGLFRKGAVKASGTITFTRSATEAALTIPAGACCTAADGATYETTAEALLASGAASVDAPARAVRAGQAGNAAANKITMLLQPSLPIARVNNAAAFVGGADAESDEALRARVLAAYATPDSGANEAYYEKLAMAQGGISSAVAEAGAAGVVTVSLAADGLTAVPAETVAAVQAVLDARRAAGFQVTAQSATALAVEISVNLAPTGDLAAAKAAVDSALAAELATLPIGHGLTRARIGQLLMASGQVQNYALLLPAADISGKKTQVLRAGAFTLGKMEG